MKEVNSNVIILQIPWFRNTIIVKKKNINNGRKIKTKIELKSVATSIKIIFITIGQNNNNQSPSVIKKKTTMSAFNLYSIKIFLIINLIGSISCGYFNVDIKADNDRLCFCQVSTLFNLLFIKRSLPTSSYRSVGFNFSFQNNSSFVCI
jgi:hypothetical protein